MVTRRYAVGWMLARELSGLAAALRDPDRRDAIAVDCLERYACSPLRLPGPVDRQAIGSLVTPVLDDLCAALSSAGADDQVGPGSAALREAEKGLSFVGATLAGHGAASFDASAFVVALRDALAATAESESERRSIAALADWFGGLVADGFSTAGAAAVEERVRERLEEATPVVLIDADLPVAFPIGARGLNAMDGVLGRLMLQIARVGARFAVIDASGLPDAQDPVVLDAVHRFVTHRHIAGKRQLVVLGLGDGARSAWQRTALAAGVPISFAESLVEARRIAAR